jgi:hypothetical protein
MKFDHTSIEGSDFVHYIEGIMQEFGDEFLIYASPQIFDIIHYDYTPTSRPYGLPSIILAKLDSIFITVMSPTVYFCEKSILLLDMDDKITSVPYVEDFLSIMRSMMEDNESITSTTQHNLTLISVPAPR